MYKLRHCIKKNQVSNCISFQLQYTEFHIYNSKYQALLIAALPRVQYLNRLQLVELVLKEKCGRWDDVDVEQEEASGDKEYLATYLC